MDGNLQNRAHFASRARRWRFKRKLEFGTVAIQADFNGAPGFANGPTRRILVVAARSG
jgi:hypothetical protein